MKNIFIYTMLTLPFINSLFSNEFYTYEEQSGNKKSHFTWNVETSDKNVVIYGEEESDSIIMYFTKDYKLYKYVKKSKSTATEIEFSLENNILQARGKVNNLNLSKRHVFKTPWVQQFGFGLKPFVLSNQPSMEFSFITPKDFSLQKMIAKKEGREYISSHGKKYETQKVTITLTGFKSKFWKARLWFDITTGDLVKYAANQGPNTEMTVDMLQSIEQKEGFSDTLNKSPENEKCEK